MNGIPATAAVPSGAPGADGSLELALALVGTAQDSREEIDAFLKRHHFAPRDEVARARDSQARWTIEPDGRITVTFLADDGTAHIALAPYEGVRRWAALALAHGGTLAVWFLPEMTSFLPEDISRRITPGGGEWWRLSVGYVPA
ncbi:hypothetical protein ACFZCP_14185 [Streptomyces sp. NPDC007971]|uniref:hypothetical protein n=1 Tax=Streptomyces sp. NPDC007971 TaxID=3364799 RepID=UPI0036E353E2